MQDENRIVIKNIFSLSVLQIANYVIPLISIPYIVRVVGVENFGYISLCLAVSTYLMIFTDYGFNLSATRLISMEKDNLTRVNEIYSSVFYVKFSLIFFSFIILLIGISNIPFMKHDKLFYLSSIFIVIGHALFPIWLFQGLEKMEVITFINITSKLLFTLLIFVLIREPEDYRLIPVFTAAGYIAASIMAFYYTRAWLNVKFVRVQINEIIFQIKNGWHIFVATVAISLYTASVIIILGLIANPYVVGQFSAADKIIQAIKGTYQPVSQAIYPYISRQISIDRVKGMRKLLRVGSIVLLLMLILSLSLFISAEKLTLLIFGNDFLEAVIYVKIMSPLPVIIAASNLLGIQALINLGYKREFNFVVSSAAVCGVLMSILFTLKLEAIGMAVSILILESVITFVLAMILLKKRRVIQE